MKLLTVAHLAKSYGGVPALVDASFDLAAGEVLALVGENGAGKSTLIRILAGATAADKGEITIAGEARHAANPQAAHGLGLRFIHQELNVVPQISVAENIFLGRSYPRHLGVFVDWAELHARAAAALAYLGIGGIAPTAIMARLSVGDRMLVKIAAAFLDGGGEARIFVMDEPTAALTTAEAERLFRVIARLKAKGCGIIYVSHRMDEVLHLSDRIAVLRDGRSVATLVTAATDRSEVISLMTGREAVETQRHERSTVADPVGLAVIGLAGGMLRDISFVVRRGEILGFAGLAGAGPSELLRTLMTKMPSGAMTLAGKPLAIRNSGAAWRQGFAYVPRERRSEGLVLSHDITANATLPHLRNLAKARCFLDRRREGALARDLGRRVRLKAAGLAQKVWQLSGGNQQKVLFARALAGNPQVLLLDEPTRGVDVGAKFDIHGLLRELAGEGAAILIASSDLPELLSLCDRIAIMRAGRLTEIVSAEGLSQAALLERCYGAAVVQHA